MPQSCYKIHVEEPKKTFQKSMPYQHSQSFPGNTEGTSNQ